MFFQQKKKNANVPIKMQNSPTSQKNYRLVAVNDDRGDLIEREFL